MTLNPDFKAELFFFPTEQSGRQNPVRSGYRPQIEFNNYPENSTSGKQIYLDKEIVRPGEKAIAHIQIFSVGYFSKRLFVGMGFSFYEGKRKIGNGIIIDLYNSDLQLEAGVTEDKININLYNKKIQQKLNLFGFDKFKIVHELQDLIKFKPELRNPRLIELILSLIIEKKQNREDVYERIKLNWKNMLKEIENE